MEIIVVLAKYLAEICLGTLDSSQQLTLVPPESL